MKPPDPPDCEEECAGKGEDVFRGCLDEGFGEDECRHRANQITALCLERCGEGNPCEDRCSIAAHIVLVGCSLANLPGEECKRIANFVLESCLEGCEEPPSCGEHCERLAFRAVQECLDHNGSEKECVQVGVEVREKCIAGCEGEPMPPCDVECREKADELRAACMEDDIHEDVCEEKWENFLAECIEHHGDDCVRSEQADLSTFNSFIRGDANRDGAVNIADSQSMLGYLFLGSSIDSCEDSFDANDDGHRNIADVMFGLSHLFLGGAPFSAPFPESGQDPTVDTLICY